MWHMYAFSEVSFNELSWWWPISDMIESPMQTILVHVCRISLLRGLQCTFESSPLPTPGIKLSQTIPTCIVHVHLLLTPVFKHGKKWKLTTGTSHRGLACESSQMIPTFPSCLHISPYMCWPHCDTQMKSPGFLYWVPWTSQKEIPCILQQNISYLENKMFKSHLSYNKLLCSKLFYLINKQFLLTHSMYIQLLKTGNKKTYS